MHIEVRITRAEIEENFIDNEHLRASIISDLDDARDYPGFNVTITIIE